MRAYINKVILPYKNTQIKKLELPMNQKLLLKLDIHYSHKDPTVLKLMRDNNIIPLYVPAGLTDIFQECDVVVNKPFKDALKASFQSHLHTVFDNHIAEGRAPALFKPKLTIGALKPQIAHFVLDGKRALETPIMQVTIMAAFEKIGLFGLMRAPERIEETRREMMEEGELLDGLFLDDGFVKFDEPI